MSVVVLKLIKIYKIFFSPDTGMLKFMFFGGCRYHLTCSSYCEKAIIKYGIVRAMPMSIKRILSCHPYSKRSIFDQP